VLDKSTTADLEGQVSRPVRRRRRVKKSKQPGLFENFSPAAWAVGYNNLDFADAYEDVRGALQETTHNYMRDEEPVRFGRLVDDLDARLNDYFDNEDPPEMELRRHLQRQRIREEEGRKWALAHPGYDPDQGEDDLDEGELDQGDDGQGDLDDQDQAPPGVRRLVDGYRGGKLQGDGGRPRKQAGEDEEDELDGFDRDELEEQRRQVAEEEEQRQRMREQNEASLHAYAARRAPWLYGRPEPPQGYAGRGRRHL
jgi:hypothetical protein